MSNVASVEEIRGVIRQKILEIKKMELLSLSIAFFQEDDEI